MPVMAMTRRPRRGPTPGMLASKGNIPGLSARQGAGSLSPSLGVSVRHGRKPGILQQVFTGKFAPRGGGEVLGHGTVAGTPAVGRSESLASESCDPPTAPGPRRAELESRRGPGSTDANGHGRGCPSRSQWANRPPSDRDGQGSHRDRRPSPGVTPVVTVTLSAIWTRRQPELQRAPGPPVPVGSWDARPWVEVTSHACPGGFKLGSGLAR